MAGSNYDVNIKLDVRKINQQISNLERRISKLNALAQGKRGDSKILLKNERDKAALLLKQERTQKKINRELAKTNKLKKENLALTKKETGRGSGTTRSSSTIRGKAMGPASQLRLTSDNNVLPGVGTPFKKPSAFTKGDISGALISGAFPLLFGQGPLGAAAGFGGGLIGSKIGGQTGGFAGGLVATAALTQIQNTIASVTKLGQAFNLLTPDIEGLTKALGANGTERERQIQLIKKTEGTQAALAAVTEQMNQQIGEKGVKDLKEFGETARMIGNSFQILGTKMLAALAPVLNFLATPFKVEAARAETNRLANVGGAADDPELKALQAQLASVTSSGGRSGSKRAQDKKNQIQAQIEARKEELALVGKGLERQTTVNMIEDSRLKKIRQQNVLLQAKIDGNYEEVLLAQELQAKIDQMVEDGAKMEELDVKKIENLMRQNNELEKQAEQAERVRQSFKSLGQSLATDVADGLQGIIRGTSTLGDMLNNVLNKMIDAAFNMAFFGNASGQMGGGGGLFGGLFGGGGGLLGGLFGGGKKGPFGGAPLGPLGNPLSQHTDLTVGVRARGGSVKAGSGYLVGERGPEMFTPGVSGMITPNHALGGTTNVVVNVDASGSSVEGDEQGGRELGRLISAAIQSELITQKRPGGLLA